MVFEQKEDNAILLCSNNGDEKTRRKLERKRRRIERDEASKQVPLVNPNGIGYTKKQIRQMKKRVSRGLSPLESEEELSERLKREAVMKREEDQEMAVLLYDASQKSTPIPTTQDDRSVEIENLENCGHDINDNDDVNTRWIKSSSSSASSQDSQHKDPSNNQKPNPSPLELPATVERRKPTRQKPVPEDYICSACKNNHKPKHWIYDCPDKQTTRGGNKRSSKGLKNPGDRKVFVSGLPFYFKSKDIIDLFQKTAKDIKVLDCKVLKYADTGRCKGQAYLTFSTEDGARQAIAMSGTKLDKTELAAENSPNLNYKGKLGVKKDGSQSMKLELKVSKCLNRLEAKRQLNLKRKRSGNDSPE
jgi:RNA recognition motif. (a.k.a. RRM, RBD, or RNP domain)